MIRVVIADDNKLLRDGVATMLRNTATDIDVVGEAHDLASLYRTVDATDPDVVVTDIRMPPTQGDEGLQAAAHYRDVRPGLGVVVLSNHVSAAYALQLLEHGDTGRAYLLKDRVASVGELAAAIRRVGDGGSVVDNLVVEHLIEGRRRQRDSVIDRLTDREREVLELVAAGRSNRVIAEELFMSIRAVEKHITAIFRKFDIFDDPDGNRRVRAVLRYLSIAAND